MEYLRTGQKLYSNTPWTATRCQEGGVPGDTIQLVAIGGFGAKGLNAFDSSGFIRRFGSYDDYGLGGLRKFS